MARRASSCVCYTSSIAEALAGPVEKNRIFVATNTLDTGTLFELKDRLVEEGKPQIRRRLGLPEEIPIIAFIGRLTGTKDEAVLIDVAAKIQNEQRIGVVIIGDGPARADLERRAEQRGVEHTYFLGAMRSLRESAPYLAAADVMLLPGPVGLAVNHAFALGLPVVAKRAPIGRRYHGPEIEYIKHGENGLLVEPDNLGALIEGIHDVLAHQERFETAASEYARKYLTLERMVDGLEQAVRFMEQSNLSAKG